MIAHITDNLNQIAALCREFNIRKLEVFGSAATGDFNPATSDIDFIVDLGGYEPGVAKRFLRFAEALEALLQHNVDLITEESIQNPYFRHSVNQSRATIYETGDRQAVA